MPPQAVDINAYIHHDGRPLGPFGVRQEIKKVFTSVDSSACFLRLRIDCAPLNGRATFGSVATKVRDGGECEYSTVTRAALMHSHACPCAGRPDANPYLS